jgi:hypothetical protein
MVRELPKVEIDGKEYYIDERLSELRNVENPHDTKLLEEMKKNQVNQIDIILKEADEKVKEALGMMERVRRYIAPESFFTLYETIAYIDDTRRNLKK